jgi:hypothetical protein
VNLEDASCITRIRTIERDFNVDVSPAQAVRTAPRKLTSDMPPIPIPRTPLNTPIFTVDLEEEGGTMGTRRTDPMDDQPAGRYTSGVAASAGIGFTPGTNTIILLRKKRTREFDSIYTEFLLKHLLTPYLSTTSFTCT